MTTRNDTEARILQIIEAIRSLTPGQRRRLLRRLRILGLWEPEEFLTDQNRLEIAPALGIETHAGSSSPPPTAESLKAAPPVSEARTEAKQPTIHSKDEYRSAVSGKVVIAGATKEGPSGRSSMAPIPGTAPEEAIAIIFDGGTRGDPACGYGSYAIRWPGMPQEVVRLRFSANVTGDEAQYDTLIAALTATLQRLQDSGAAPERAKLDIRGDSGAVLSQVRGVSEIGDSALKVRSDRVRALLRRFGSWTLSRYHRERGSEVHPT